MGGLFSSPVVVLVLECLGFQFFQEFQNFPSSVMFFIAWFFMLTTAILMVEIMGWFKKPVNLVSVVEHTLGPIGKMFCSFLYLFLFYALLVAYMATSGNHASLFIGNTFHLSLPNWAGSFFLVVLFGWLVYLGTKPVDHVNRYCMYVVILGSNTLCLAFCFTRNQNTHYLPSQF